MSALFVDASAWAPTAVLMASLLGSGHCVAMCGGLILASAPSRRSQVVYHLGRLLGYLTLGGMAGWVGSQVLTSFLSWGAALFISSVFILMGIRLWRGGALHISIIPASITHKLFKIVRGRAFGVGLLSALLPCGWLHVFVLAAISARTALAGASLLFVFWLGTLPALSSASWLVDRFLRPVSRRAPRFAALILIAAGVLGVGIKAKPIFAKSEHVCHHSTP
ncbi:sulfite exporter TauE/SafE family protein [bacterium]|nr:sulfite exporter TauE/SafE family protein [bacterium]